MTGVLFIMSFCTASGKSLMETHHMNLLRSYFEIVPHSQEERQIHKPSPLSHHRSLYRIGVQNAVYVCTSTCLSLIAEE